MRYFTLLATLPALCLSVPTSRKGDHVENHKGSHWRSYGPFDFTSTYKILATPNQVVNASNAYTGGLEGAQGWFNYGINSLHDVICYNITLTNFRGNYSSPATTATHIHEATVGKSGPPRYENAAPIAFPNETLTCARIAFPNPTGNGTTRNSIGCLKGPFKTGIVTNGTDSGDGFRVKKIEDNPALFFTDVHSSLAVPGAVRGQLNTTC